MAAQLLLRAELTIVFLFSVRTIAGSGVNVIEGLDCVLPCSLPEGEVLVASWRINSDRYLLFYRNGKLIESNQDPSYRNRVKLKESELQSGDFSVILRNVTLNDSGNYICDGLVQTSERKETFIRTVELNVLKISGDADLESRLRKRHRLGFGLSIALITIIITIASMVFALRKSSYVNKKLFQHLHLHFCLEKQKPRKRVISSSSSSETSSSVSESSTKALIQIHREAPVKVDQYLHVPKPLPPFRHPLVPSSSSSAASTLTTLSQLSKSDSALASINSEVENLTPVSRRSFPDV